MSSKLNFFTSGNLVTFPKIIHQTEFQEAYDKIKDDSEFKIYKDLKKKGFYVTSGFKYGANFLAYRDDPNFIHSEYLVNVQDFEKEIPVSQIIQNERISVSNRKKLLIATLDNNLNIKYFHLGWITF